MENSLNDTDQPYLLNSPPRRRRSTFFQRRDTLVLQDENDVPDIVAHNDNNQKALEERLQSYYSELLKESKSWKAEANARRNAYRDQKQQLKRESSTSTAAMDYSVLTDEDIEFLKGKPNVVKIAEDAIELQQAATRTMLLFRSVHELDNYALTQCEDKVKKVTKYILENSTIEAVE